jgi:hypothetical protein
VAIARGAAQTAVTVAGFRDATVKVSPDALSVAIAIPASEACTAQAGDQASIERQIKLIASFVQTVTITVAGSGSSLVAYLGAHCSGNALPSGPGAVVYQHAGKGVLTKPPSFTVTAPRWSIDYANQGSYLSVFVFRNGKLQPQPIALTHRGSGTKTFTGPGSIQLKIAGSGHWSVRVRDGA